MAFKKQTIQYTVFVRLWAFSLQGKNIILFSCFFCFIHTSKRALRSRTIVTSFHDTENTLSSAILLHEPGIIAHKPDSVLSLDHFAHISWRQQPLILIHVTVFVNVFLVVLLHVIVTGGEGKIFSKMSSAISHMLCSVLYECCVDTLHYCLLLYLHTGIPCCANSMSST